MAGRDEGAYVVVLATSLMLIRGSALSGQRRMQGANTMARELGDMRLCGSSLDTLPSRDKTWCWKKHLKNMLLFILSSFIFRSGETIYRCQYSKDVHRSK